MRTPNDDAYSAAVADGMHPDDAGPMVYSLEYYEAFRRHLATVMFEDGIRHKWVSKWRIKENEVSDGDS